MPQEKRYTKDKDVSEPIGADAAFLDKTREVVNFLTHIYSDNMSAVTCILLAQANGDTGKLKAYLGIVDDFVRQLKKQLDEL